MNPKFPKAARPARQKIRKFVARPKELPKPSSDGSINLCWGTDCPWLLVPTSSDTCGVNPCPFWAWWDNCTDAQQAVDTVWGKVS